MRHRNRQNLPVQSTNVPHGTSRSKLVFRVILFQFKLAADGFRDLLLSPLSIVAGLLGILFSRDDPHYYFDKLLKTGRSSDRWINLFDTETTHDFNQARDTLDDLAQRFEDLVRKDYEADGLTAKTAQKFEDILNNVRTRQR